MSSSITRNLSLNPRSASDLSTSIDKKQPNFNDILEDQSRVSFYDLEGDFPRPSSIAPGQGALKYYYLGNYTHENNLVPIRQRLKQRWRGPYGTGPDSLGVQDSRDTASFRLQYRIEVPNNNSWFATYEFDDKKRDIKEETIEYRYQILPSGWDETDGAVLTARDQPTTTAIIPLILGFTTSPFYAQNPSYRFVPPGCTILFDFEVLEQTEDEFLSIEADDIDWETGTSENTDIKPQEEPRTEVRARQLIHNQSINEEPFDESGFYESITLPASLRKTTDRYSNLERHITATLGLRESAEAAMRDIRKIGIGSSVGDHWPGPVWYESFPQPKHFWSAQYVGFVLYQSGLDALQTQSSLDYCFYGNEVDWRGWERVRKYDIVVFKFKNSSGGHVGFVERYNPRDNSITVIGGNQLGQVRQSEYLVDSIDMYVANVRRNWPDPGENFSVI